MTASDMAKNGPAKSFPFPFGEWRLQTTADWPKDTKEAVTPRAARFTDRWVYVFAHLGGATLVKYEIWVDGVGNRSVTDEQDMFDPVTARPSGGGEPFHSLPLVLRGERPVYTFFVSRIRLPKAVLDRLARHEVTTFWGKKRNVVRHYVPAAIEWSEADEPLYHYVIPDEEPFVPALLGTDPVTVALGLAEAYRRNLKRYDRHMQREGEDEREAEKERFTRELFELLRSSPHLYDLAEGRLRTEASGDLPGWLEDREDLGMMYDYLRRRARPRRELVAAYERSAFELCRWLSSDLFQIYAEAYRLNERSPDEEGEQAHLLVDLMEELLRELDRSFVGFVYLHAWCSEAAQGRYAPHVLDPKLGHFLTAFVFREEAAGTNAFKTIRYSAKSVAHLVNHVAMPWVASLPKQQFWDGWIRAKTVAGLRPRKYIEHGIFDIEFVKETQNQYVLRERAAHPQTLAKQYPELFFDVVVRKQKPDGAMVRAWLEREATAAVLVEDVTAVTQALGRALDVLNIAVALRQVSDQVGRKGGSLLDRPTAEAAAHTYRFLMNELALHFGKTEQAWLQAFAGKMGAVGNLYFVSSNLDAIAKATASGDRDRALAYAVATGGEIISGLALFGAFGTVGAFAGGVGFVIGALGYVGAILLTRSPFEVFIDHGEWGRLYHETIEKQPWIPSRPSGGLRWREAYDVQRQALFNLVGGFSARSSATIAPHDLPVVQIRFGYVGEESSLEVRWRVIYEEGDEVEKIDYDVWGPTLFKGLGVEEGVHTYYLEIPFEVRQWMQAAERRPWYRNYADPYHLSVGLRLKPFNRSDPDVSLPKGYLPVRITDEGRGAFETVHSLAFPH